MTDQQNTVDLLLATLDMVRDKIDDAEWLQKLATAANAESAICVRWLDSQPDLDALSTYGPCPDLPAGWRNWADHIIDLYAPSRPALLDAMLAKLNRPELNEANPLQDPQMLIGLVDWTPSNMFLMVHRDPLLGAWTAEEREHFQYLLDISRRSISLHKDFARANYLGSSAIDILNNSPRGIVALSMDGTIQFLNIAAQSIVSSNDGIASRNGKLVLKNNDDQAALNEFLKTASVLKYDQISNGPMGPNRNMSVSRPSGRMAYQMLVNIAPVTGWRLEASHSDRMALVTLFDPMIRKRPRADTLRGYFNLTAAQARLAEQLYASDNLTAAAAALGISQNTARSHLRAIFAKIGVNTQSELFTLLTSTLTTPAEENPVQPPRY